MSTAPSLPELVDRAFADADPRPRVLLAEDDAALLYAFRRVLETAGYRVLVATDGVQAVELERQALPDLVLLDVQMPRMDGVSAAEVMLQDEGLRRPRILLMTASDDPRIWRDAERLGLLGVLPKPIRMETLRAEVAAAVEGRRLEVAG